MDAYQKRLIQEARKAWVEGLLINTLLVYHAAFCSYALVVWMSKQKLSDVGWTEEVALGLVPAAIVAGLLWTRSPHSTGRTFIERTNDFLARTRVEPRGTWWMSPSGLFTSLALLLTIVVGWKLTRIRPSALFSADGAGGARRIFGALFTPDWSIIGITLEAMAVTIFIALMATLIAVPIAFAASFFAARNLMRASARARAVYTLSRLVSNFTRSIEPLIWAIIFSVWVGIGPFAGMLALMLHSVASLVKLYSEQIENVDKGPIEAIEATGANWLQVLWYAVVPQIVLPYLSFTIYRWDINIRMATVIGLVGGGGIGTLLIQYQGLARWHEVGTMVITIAVVVWLMDYLSARIREAIY